MKNPKYRNEFLAQEVPMGMLTRAEFDAMRKGMQGNHRRYGLGSCFVASYDNGIVPATDLCDFYECFTEWVSREIAEEFGEDYYKDEKSEGYVEYDKRCGDWDLMLDYYESCYDCGMMCISEEDVSDAEWACWQDFLQEGNQHAYRYEEFRKKWILDNPDWFVYNDEQERREYLQSEGYDEKEVEALMKATEKYDVLEDDGSWSLMEKEYWCDDILEELGMRPIEE